MREAKPCTLFTTMTSNPADHVRYLLDGHGQLEGTEPEVWTKGIPKASRIRQKVAAYWDDVHELWEERTAKQAKMTGKQVFVALPNDIKPEEAEKVAKAVLRTVPQHHPATFTVHWTSGKDGRPNVHLHGVISMRRGGYGKTDDAYRLNSRALAKEAVDKTLKKCGYTIVNKPKTAQVTARPSRQFVQWMKRTYSEQQLQNPEFLRKTVLPEAKGKKAQAWLQQEIQRKRWLRDTAFYKDAEDIAPFSRCCKTVAKVKRVTRDKAADIYLQQAAPIRGADTRLRMKSENQPLKLKSQIFLEKLDGQQLIGAQRQEMEKAADAAKALFSLSKFETVQQLRAESAGGMTIRSLGERTNGNNDSSRIRRVEAPARRNAEHGRQSRP